MLFWVKAQAEIQKTSYDHLKIFLRIELTSRTEILNTIRPIKTTKNDLEEAKSKLQTYLKS
jgi:hypothetical protein